MNKKYNEFQQKIKEWKKQGYDKNLLQGLFNLSNPVAINYDKDLRQGTNYSDLSDEQFKVLFKSDVLSKLNTEQLQSTFQELHNRYMAYNGYDVSRNVVVKQDAKNPCTFGYVNSENDMLFINKYAIDNIKNNSLSSNSSLNYKNIGVGLHHIITHESQHVCQFESAIDFANGVRKDPRSDFLAAMVAIEQANFSKVQEDTNILYALKWKKNYSYQYIEHDANYKAYEATKSNFGNDDNFKREYMNYLNFAGLISLRGVPTFSIDKFVDKRVNKIEKFAKYEIDYFNKHIEDCPLKQELMNTVNKYMENKNNSESNFRSDLKDEIHEILLGTVIYSTLLGREF